MHLLLSLMVAAGALWAQPGTMSINQDVGGTYSNSGTTLKGGVFQARFQENAGGTSSGTRNWQFNADAYFNTWGVLSTNGASSVTLAAYNTSIQPNAATASANFEGGPGYNNKGRLPATTANFYYTYNIIKGSSYASQLMSVLETSFDPVAVSSVTQAVGTFGSRAISITTSATPAAGENIFVRYTTDGYVTSTIVQATGSGTAWSATIPWQSSAVSFYVYTSNISLSAINADVTTNGQAAHDLAMLNLNNNAGANYSWTPVTGNIIVTSTGGTGAAGVGYSTFTVAGGVFAALNAGTAHTGTVTALITANVTTETGATTLSNSAIWTALGVQPSGARTVSGAATAGAPLIDFNGADNVTVDGLNANGHSLTISNTTVSSTSGTSTIRFQGDATSNTITNCSVLGSATMASGTNGGNIWFGSAAVSTGNDNNTVSNCNIGPAGANLPTKGIYFSGSSNINPGTANSGISIIGNNIFDYFSATAASTGIDLNSGSTNLSITNNKFYQTATRTQTIGAQHSAIRISNTSGNAYIVTGNTIGFASSAGTGTYTFVGVSGSVFYPISLAVGTTTASSVQGNTIAGIALSGTQSGTTTTAPFIAIAMTSGSAGLVNIGNITGNTIGSLSATGSITYTSSSTSTSEIYGFLNNGVSATVFSNNAIGGINVANSTTGTVNFYGIQATTSTSSTATYINNIIGGTVANSINNTATSTSSVLIGIRNVSSAPALTATGNIIRNMNLAAGNTGTGSSASVVGILHNNSTPTPNVISQNTIFNLSNSNAVAATVVTGIFYGGTTGSNLVERNLIHSLSVSTSSTSAAVNGIVNNGGTTAYQNNMIRLGIDGSGASQTVGYSINGINDVTGTNNFFHNSVYVGGSSVVSVSNTFAFNSTVTTNTRLFQNNIFVNARSNASGTGKNYAVQVGGTSANPAGLTINYNIYQATGTGGVLGRFNALDVADLAAWRTAVGQDANSISSDPKFIAPTGTSATVDLHIQASPVVTPVEGTGLSIGSVTTDYDGATRSGLTPTDIGADAGNFTTGDFTTPTITYTNLPNTTLLTNITLTATIADVGGIPVAGALQPRIYYRKGAGTWFSAQGALQTGNGNSGTWDFIINNTDMGGVMVGDVISYYVIAQDNAGNIVSNPSAGLVATDVNTVTTAPTTPNSYQIIPNPLSGTYTVGAAGNYTTLTAAVNAYNNAGVAGPVVFSLTDAAYAGETYPITINTTAGASATNTLIIKPTQAATTFTGSSASALVVLNGADYVTIDGSTSATANTVCPASSASRNLTFTQTSTSTTSAVIWLQTATGANAATNNTIINCNLVGNSNTTTLFGVGSGSTTISISSLGAGNNNNSFINNNISKTQYGIYSQGASAASKNTGTVINQNLINTAAPNNVAKVGIHVGFENTISISGNSISNLAAASGYAWAISAGNVTSITTSVPTGNEVTNATITNNNIGTIRAANTFGAGGILVAPATAGTTLIANNVVSDVAANGTSGDCAIGIMVAGGTGSTTQIYFNSVSLSATLTGGSGPNIALAIGGTTPIVDIKNNILASTGNTGTGANRAIALSYSSTLGNYTNLTSNNNNFFVSGGGTTLGIAMTGGWSAGTVRITRANWTTETGRDGSSIETNPNFNSNSNLVLQIGSGAVGTGVAGTGITTDITCATRANPPSMGAYDTPADLSGPTIVYTAFTNTCTGGSRTLTATISDASGVPQAGAGLPTAYFKINAGAYTAATGTWVSGNTYTFDIGAGTVGGDVVAYYVVAQDGFATPNVSVFPAAGAAGFTINPPAVATPPTTPSSYTVNLTLNGTYTVGVGGNFATLTAAVAVYNGGCNITGPVVFSLIDASYAAETYPIAINTNAGASATNTLTIKPTQAATTFTGSSASALITINGADYVTIDGSTSATANTVCPASSASRNLTLTNTSSSTSSAVIWLQTATADGATNNTVKNCNLVGSGNAQTFVGVGSGSSTISTASLGTGNNNNSFINNNISKTQYGIFSQGASAANKNTGTVINQNLINTASPNNVAISGVRVGFENGIVISGNNIDNLQAPIGGTVDGIAIALGSGSVTATTFTGNEVINATVTHNIIGTVRGSDTYSAIGIYQTTTTNTGTSLFANNMIGGVNSNATSSDLSAGIFIGSMVGTINVFYNTVTMVGTFTGGDYPSFGLAATSASTVLNIRNNIFTSTGTTGANLNRAMGFAYNTYTNLNSNNNDLFVSGTGAAAVQTASLGSSGATSYTNVLGAGSWNAASGKDANSLNLAPVFVSTTDLHLVKTGGVNCTLRGAGAPVAVTNDIDCDIRHASFPGIGADEFGGKLNAGSITGTISVCIGATTALGSNGDAGGTWSSGDMTKATVVEATGVVTGVAAGTAVITYTVTDATGCTSATTATVTVNALPNAGSISGTTSVCVGSTTDLDSDGLAGGAWSSGDLTKATVDAGTGVVTGLLAGTTVISYTATDGNGCVSTAMVTVTVNALPNAGTIAGTTSVCVGSATDLDSDGVAGGVWSSGDVTKATVDAGTGVVTGVVAGTAVISYTVTDNNGCVSTAMVTVTVNALPNAGSISGTTSVCVGSNTALGTNGLDGGVWSSGNITKATVVAGTGVVTGVAAGSAIISYTATDGNGCVSTAMVMVTVNPLPNAGVIGGTTSVCVGSTTDLNSNGEANGVWSSGDMTKATVDAGTGVVTGVLAGTAVISYTVTDGNGCVSTAMTTVTVNALPNAGSISGTTSVCVGSTTDLNSNGEANGVWSSGDMTKATVDAGTGVVTGVAAGTAVIYYTVTDGNGCVSTAMTTVTVNALPNAGSISGTLSVCVGLTTDLGTNGDASGVWSSGDVTKATVNNGTGLVMGVAAGSPVITYTVTDNNGCVSATMTIVTVNANPQLFSVTGGGVYCTGGAGLSVGLSGSEIGVNYQLKKDNVNQGSPVAGTGAALAFPVQTASGTYTVEATGTAPVCTIAMTGSVTISAVSCDCYPSIVSASPAAYDDGWQTGDNDNPSGFGPWALSTTNPSSSFNGHFIGNSTGNNACGVPNGDSNADGDINGAGDAWGLYANGGGQANAVRPFLSNMVIGGSFKIRMDNGCVDASQAVGFGIQNASGNNLSEFYFQGGGTDYVLNDGSGVSNTGIGFSDEGVEVVYTRTGASTYTVKITRLVDGATVTLARSFNNPAGGQLPKQVRLFNGNAGSGSNADAFFNNMEICIPCTPISATLSGVATICAGNSANISASITGGVGPYTLVLFDGANNSTVTEYVSGTNIPVSPASNSTYTIVSITDALGCGASATLSGSAVITVTQLPNPGVISGTLTVCTGLTTTLTSNGLGGGTWSSSNTEIAAVGSGTGVVTGITAGVVTITYSVTASSCPNSTSIQVTVTQTPNAGTISGNATVCTGLTTNLTSNGLGGGTWSSNNLPVATVHPTTGVVTGVTSGTATITYMVSASGCNSSTTRLVTVNQTPNAGTISGTTTVCSGLTTSLSSNGLGGGTWSSNNLPVATVNPSNGVVTGVSGGTATITYTVTANGCTSSTNTLVTVNQTPSAGVISGTTTVCTGLTTALSSNGAAGGTWSSGNPTSASVNPGTGLVSGVASGSATITYTVTASGCTNSTNILVTVNQTPNAGTISGTTTVCSGLMATLGSNGLGGGAWSSSNGSVATVNPINGVVTGVAGGSATITYTVTANGCTSSTNTLVTVNQTPNAGVIGGTTTVCAGQTTQLNSNGLSGGTWMSSNTGVATIDGNGLVSGLNIVGGTTITYTVTSGGCTSSTTATVTVISSPNPGTIVGSTGCIGTTTNFTSTGQMGGAWSSSNMAVATINPTSGVLTGVSGGTTTVTYTLTFGSCSASTSTLVTVSACNAIFGGRIIWSRDGITGVKDATVTVSGSASGSVVTPASGLYSITVSPGSSFTITPTKTLNKFNGVNAQDVFRINQHATLNPLLISNPYELVAADVNGNNLITQLDANIIQLSLLGNTQALAQWISSWRFVPTSHTMTNPPWGFPEKVTLTGSASNVNFYGIKVGDVTAIYANPANGGTGAPFVLRTPDQVLEAGRTIEVEFAADALSDIAALQFALRFDPEQLQLANIMSLNGLPLSGDNFGTYEAETGSVRMVWAGLSSVALKQTAPVFRLTFTVLESGSRLSEVLGLDDATLPGHVYNSLSAESGVSLRFDASTAVGNLLGNGQVQLLQNRPNPFVHDTRIGFILPEACEAQLRIFDAAGRLVAERTQQYPAGRHDEAFDLSGVSGLLYYELTTPFGVLAKKMTKVE